MGKVFWLDTETTGVDPINCAIVQIAGLVELNGQVVDSINLDVCPFDGALITEDALKVIGKTEQEIFSYPNHAIAYHTLETFLNGYINKYNKNDKFVLAGYNVGFDDQFMRAFFNLNNNKYYGSYFMWPKIDVQGKVAELCVDGLLLPNHQLSTVCNRYGVSLVAHDALSDIKATRELYYVLRGVLNERVQAETVSRPNGGAI